MEIKQVFDRDLESYSGLFDRQWAESLLNQFKNTKIYEPLFELLFAWREMDMVYQTPWLFVHKNKAFGDSFARAFERTRPDFFAGLIARLHHEMISYLHTDQMDLLARIVGKIAADVQVKAEKEPVEIDRNFLWEKYFEEAGIRFSISGTLKYCFSNICHAYEVFVLRVYKLAAKKDDYRIHGKDFSKDLNQLFGSEFSQVFWKDRKTACARLIRNALVHNGGRVTKDLQGKNHGVCVYEDRLQILPKDCRELYLHLKEQVERMIPILTAKINS
jgi:hypothetical protein